jgi:hypothetical protein
MKDPHIVLRQKKQDVARVRQQIQALLTYLGKIYEKIGVKNRLELALWFEGKVHEGSLLKTSGCIH